MYVNDTAIIRQTDNHNVSLHNLRVLINPYHSLYPTHENRFRRQKLLLLGRPNTAERTLILQKNAIITQTMHLAFI